jgi:uncharacterized membrane protein YoaK (UPF0700 family)/anti-anti-sigma regulatory factor
MLAVQAHSFTQQARLAITLAWVAGYTNILTILSCGTVTSHMSGTTSNLGRDVAEGKWAMAGFALFVMVLFFLGAALSGVATETARRRGWESVYVLPIAIEAALLAVFAGLLELQDHSAVQTGWTPYAMTGVAAGAMGLQNATITRISSGVVRTTHVTGVLTDLGTETVQFLYWLRDRATGRAPEPAAGAPTDLLHSVQAHPGARRLALLASIVGGFALGAGLGTLAYDHLPRFAMFPPVVFLLWIIYKDVTTPIAEIEESDLIGDASMGLPASLAIFHLRRRSGGQSRIHRMPNLLDWSERLAHGTRVVVLDLAGVEQLDANAALELRALLARFKLQRRRLIICGINNEQFTRLRHMGAGEFLVPANTCPDIDLAVARALNLLQDAGHESAGL